MTVTTRNERRQHSRHEAHIILEIRGQVDGSRIAEIRGVTVDVGRGGALVVFPDDVPTNPDNPFMVRFVDAAGAVIAPGFRWGAVLRSDRVRSDSFVAVKFQQPLPPFVLGELLGANLAPATLSAGKRLHPATTAYQPIWARRGHEDWNQRAPRSDQPRRLAMT